MAGVAKARRVDCGAATVGMVGALVGVDVFRGEGLAGYGVAGVWWLQDQVLACCCGPH